jgi:hypothetical protein
MHTDPDFRYLRRGRVRDCREQQKYRNDEAETVVRIQNFTCLTKDIAYFYLTSKNIPLPNGSLQLKIRRIHTQNRPGENFRIVEYGHMSVS